MGYNFSNKKGKKVHMKVRAKTYSFPSICMCGAFTLYFYNTV